MEIDMIYLPVEPLGFAEFYGLSTEIKCSKCGKYQRLVNPFVFMDSEGDIIVGVEADEHACGPRYIPGSLVALDVKKRQKWASLFDTHEGTE